MKFLNIFKKKSPKIYTKKITPKIVNDFSHFDKVIDIIYEKSGISDLNKRTLTASKLQNYANQHNIYTTNDFLKRIKSDINFEQDVINLATVNATFFFREIKELKWLVEYIKNSDTKLKILSMPCSSGEEIFSIIMLMDMQNIPLEKIELVGYDINSKMINSARDRVYNEHSMHKLPQDMIDKYFVKKGKKHYTLSNDLRDAEITFQQNNIFNFDTNSQKYDVVLSRNMFIYFDKEKRIEALNIILNLLKENGIYIKGHADNITQHHSLESIRFGVFKKINPPLPT